MSSPTLDKLLKIYNRKKDDLALTQVKLAKALRISQPAISQYLSGKVPLNTKFICSIARVLQIPPTELDPSLQQIVLLARQKGPSC